MRRTRTLACSWLIVCLLLSQFVPATLADDNDTPVDTSCPEGLVYVASSDSCQLPENVPPGEEDPAVTEPSTDPNNQDGQDSEDNQPDQNTGGDQGDQAADSIANLTLQTAACTQAIENGTPMAGTSADQCSTSADPAPTYTILAAGSEVQTASLGQGVDLAASLGANGTSLPTGTWTIRENTVAGFGNPYVQCQVTADDGSVSAPVNGIVAGGSVDLTLGAGDAASCQWWSQRSQTTQPRQGLVAVASSGLIVRVVVTLCSPTGCETELPLPAPLTVVVARDEIALPSQTMQPATPDVSFAVPDDQTGGGEWAMSLPDAPANWEFLAASCLVTPANGSVQYQPQGRPWNKPGLGTSVEIGANESVACQLVISNTESTSRGFIRFHGCPDTIDPSTSTPADRDAACRLVEDTNAFTPSVALNGDVDLTGPLNNILPGTMSFALSAGTWQIAIRPGTGQAMRLAECDHLIAQLGQRQTIEMPISDNSFSIETGEGDSLTCDVYLGTAPLATPTPTVTPSPTPTMTPTPNTAPSSSGDTQKSTTSGTSNSSSSSTSSQSPSAPTPTPAQPATGVSALAIQAWTCPADADLTAPIADLMKTCTVTSTGTTWLLNQQPLSASGGAALWGNLPLGEAKVTYQGAAAATTTGSVVTCSMAPANQAAIVTVAIPVTQGSIQLVFEQPASVYCNWFLQP